MNIKEMIKMRLHNIKLRHMLVEETEYTKMLDKKDWQNILFHKEKEEQDTSAAITINEPSYKEAKKKIGELFKDFPFER